METLIPDDSKSRLGRFASITMFLMTPGGRERKESAYRALAEEAGFVCGPAIHSSSSKGLLELSA